MKLRIPPSAILFAAVLVIAMISGTVSHAALYTLNTSDVSPVSSFNSAGNWISAGVPSAAAPSAGNTYSVGSSRILLTPGSGSWTFGGDSLTIASGGSFTSNNSALMTVNNLILAGGAFTAGNNKDLAITGNLNVTSNSFLSQGRGSINIRSAISGSGNLSISSWIDQSQFVDAAVRLYSASNTYTGSIVVNLGQLILMDNARMNFNIGLDGINNNITRGTNARSTATFNGDFHFDLTNASTTVGDSWNIVDVASFSAGKVVFGDTFTVNGFTNEGTLWTNGIYVFDEFDGRLYVSVIPEPNAATLLLMGIGAFALTRRLRRLR